MSSSTEGVGSAPVKSGPFSPFRHNAFLLLWTATLVSNVGTWMHEVGAGWLMSTLNSSPAVVSLVQAATTLPVFLFALFAGTLADRFDKRRMLLVINVVLTMVISTLTLLVWTELVTPALLVLFTFAIGIGAAFMAPAWQAIVPQLVPRSELKPAIALNSMGINLSRAIGPALAGILIAAVGLAAPFAINAISHLAIILALLLWRPEAQARKAHHGPILTDMALGLRHVRHNAPMLATLVRAAAFFLFASAYWALLPLIAREADGGGAELYGMLMGLIGAGAVTGALVLPKLQARLNSNATVWVGTAGTGVALLSMAVSASAATLMLAAFLGGLSWIAVLTSFNVSAQTALPNWVRARGISVFLMVFFGSMSLGSLIWGQVATYTSIPLALIIAAALLGVAAIVTRNFEIGQAESLDLSPVSAWPDAPPLTDGTRDDRQAMVSIEYRIASADQERFLQALRDNAHERYRDGAVQWSVYESVETPGTWIETFVLPSWAEHLEQHKRTTAQDAAQDAALKAFDTRESGPLVKHFIRPEAS